MSSASDTVASRRASTPAVIYSTHLVTTITFTLLAVGTAAARPLAWYAEWLKGYVVFYGEEMTESLLDFVANGRSLTGAGGSGRL